MGRDKEGLRHRAQTSAQPDLQDTEVVRRRMMRMLMVMMGRRRKMVMPITAMIKKQFSYLSCKGSDYFEKLYFVKHLNDFLRRL